MRSNIFHYYHDGNSTKTKIMDAYELEDNLLFYMEEEFGVVLEDGSEVEIANLICTMYEACVGRGDVTLAQSVVQNAMRAEEAMKASNVTSVFQSGQEDIEDEESCNDDDEYDDDEMMEEDCDIQEVGDGNINQEQEASMQLMNDGQIESRISMEQIFASGSLFAGPPTKPKKELPPPRQLGEPEPEKPQPVVDEDGFAMVPTKKKGGGKRSN